MNELEHEEKRLLALRRFGLLDTAPEAIFDGVTTAIANICQAPIALLSLVDSDRQWFKSSCGLNVQETPRDVAFCHHAISRPDEMMVVEDATADPRFRDNPLVTENPNIRFYAGKPIVVDEGLALGTLCVIDRKARSLLPHQAEALSALSGTISAVLAERQRLQDIAIDRDSMEDVLNERSDRFQLLYGEAETLLRGVLDRLPCAAVAINSNARIVSSNAAWREFVSGEGWVSTNIGEDYLDLSNNFFESSRDHRRQARDGITRVLSGKLDHYEITSSGSVGSWTMEAQPICQPVKGALVQHYYSAQN